MPHVLRKTKLVEAKKLSRHIILRASNPYPYSLCTCEINSACPSIYVDDRIAQLKNLTMKLEVLVTFSGWGRYLYEKYEFLIVVLTVDSVFRHLFI